MKKFFTQILILVVICLTGLYFWQSKQLKESKEEIKELQVLTDKIPAYEASLKRLKTEKSEYAKKVEKFKQEIEKNEQEISKLQTEISETTDELTNAAATAKEEEKSGNKLLSGISDMLENPEMRDAIRSQIKAAQITPIYGSLIKKMNLSPDKEEALMDLIADKLLVGADAIKSLSSGDETAYEEVIKNINKQKEEVNQQIKDLLGEDAYKEYEKYSNTEGERMIVSQFNQQLSFSDAPALTEEQNEMLVKIMKEENDAIKKNPDYVNTEDLPPSKMNDDLISDILFQQIDANKKIKDRAKTVLSPEQFMKFEDYQESFVKQMEMGLKMSAQMFGGQNNE